MVKADRTKDWDSLLEHCNAMVKGAKERVEIQAAMRQCYDLEWDEEALKHKPLWVMDTMDTQPADSIDWLADVLSTSDVAIEIKIPDDAIAGLGADVGKLGDEADEEAIAAAQEQQGMVNRFKSAAASFMQRFAPGKAFEPTLEQKAKDTAESLEAIARSIFKQNDKRRDTDLRRELVHNGFLYDQVAVKCADLRLTKLWEGGQPETRGRSPFVFVAVDPKTLYCEWDDLGLSAVLQRDVRSLRNVKAVYGKVADLGKAEDLQDANGNVMFAEWWTRDETAKWIEKTLQATDKPDMQQDVVKYVAIDEIKPNSLGFIPIIVKTCRGRREDIRPILYNGWKSKIFRSANMFLTMLTTEAFKTSIGQWIQTGVPPNEDALTLDFTKPNVYPLKPTQDLKPLPVPPDLKMREAMEMIMSRQDSTTVSKIIAGQSPGGVEAASAINLLTHGAQLILAPVQRATEELYEALVQMLFDYVKVYDRIYQGEGRLELWVDAGTRKIEPAELPNWLDIRCRITADLPQDKIAMVNMAVQARASRPPLVSRKTAWDWIGIEDTNKETERLEDEAEEATKGQGGGQSGPPQLPGGPPQGPPPGLPAQVLPPTVPVEQNPMVANPMEQQAQSMQNGAQYGGM